MRRRSVGGCSDCDDGDPRTYPGAAQVCDGNDNTCGGAVPADEMDVDGDDHVACSGWDDTQGDQPDIDGGGDCDESNAFVITSEVIFVGFNYVVGSDLIPEYLWSGAEVMRAFQFPLHLLNLTELT